jgi:hypothetical protein
MNETKTVFFKIRLTPTEKRKLEEYAEEHKTTMSEAIKKLCKEIFKEDEK